MSGRKPGPICIITAYLSYLQLTLFSDHVAVVRNGQTLTLYIQGAAVATSSTTSATSFSASASLPFFIGSDTTYRSLAGYLSNFRIVIGTAVYTVSPFTPPALPLTAIPGTSLLLNAANSAEAYNDSSGNNVIASIAGSSSWANANPFYQGGSSGSLYFLGTTTSVITVPTSATNFGTGPFTIEFYCYALSKATERVFAIGAIGAGPLLSLELQSGGVGATIVLPGGVNGVNTIGAYPVVYNTWQHWAVVRNGNTISVYCQGFQILSVATTAGQSYSSSASLPFYIGSDTTAGSQPRALLGYLSSFRIVVGTAIYTAPFVPPVSALSAVAGTTLLLAAADSTAPIADSSGNGVVVSSINVAWSPFGPLDTGPCTAPTYITCSQVRLPADCKCDSLCCFISHYYSHAVLF